MKCLITDQGTAAHETGLCEMHFTEVNQIKIRCRAKYIDDIDSNSDFIDCDKNEAVSCSFC